MQESKNSGQTSLRRYFSKFVPFSLLPPIYPILIHVFFCQQFHRNNDLALFTAAVYGRIGLIHGFLTATCAQFPSKVAEEAVKQAYAAISGGCEHKEVVIPVELLTEENVDQYGIDGWQ